MPPKNSNTIRFCGVCGLIRSQHGKIYMILGKREKHAENSGKHNVFLISDIF